MKIFFAVDVEMKQALAMLVTTDGTHDSRVFPKLLRKAERQEESLRFMGTERSTVQRSTSYLNPKE